VVGREGEKTKQISLVNKRSRAGNQRAVRQRARDWWDGKLFTEQDRREDMTGKDIHWKEGQEKTNSQRQRQGEEIKRRQRQQQPQPQERERKVAGEWLWEEDKGSEGDGGGTMRRPAATVRSWSLVQRKRGLHGRSAYPSRSFCLSENETTLRLRKQRRLRRMTWRKGEGQR
jgi:hypothetical protein